MKILCAVLVGLMLVVNCLSFSALSLIRDFLNFHFVTNEALYNSIWVATIAAVAGLKCFKGCAG